MKVVDNGSIISLLIQDLLDAQKLSKGEIGVWKSISARKQGATKDRLRYLDQQVWSHTWRGFAEWEREKLSMKSLGKGWRNSHNVFHYRQKFRETNIYVNKDLCPQAMRSKGEGSGCIVLHYHTSFAIKDRPSAHHHERAHRSLQPVALTWPAAPVFAVSSPAENPV